MANEGCRGEIEVMKPVQEVGEPHMTSRFATPSDELRDNDLKILSYLFARYCARYCDQQEHEREIRGYPFEIMDQQEHEREIREVINLGIPFQRTTVLTESEIGDLEKYVREHRGTLKFIHGGGVIQQRSVNEPDPTVQPRYKMDAKPRGRCVVINNDKFDSNSGLGDREGSDVDRDSLKKSFDRLGFSVDILENVTDLELRTKLKEYSEFDHSCYDCFALFVLSHGDENHVCGTNGGKVDLKEIRSLFTAESCPTLAGKPKMIFTQACRGLERQEGVECKDTFEPHTTLIPNEADFFFGNATVENYVSYRDPSEGSFFINALTKVLDTYGDREDFLTMMTRVNYEVSKRVVNTDGKTWKQIPAPQHTLRKQLYFF